MVLNWLIILVYLLSGPPENPRFKGGERALTSFLANNQIYPAYSKANCIQGTIMVSFKLNREGDVYESEVQKGFGVDLDKEALRLIRLSSGKWNVPADYDTSLSLVLPVNFSLREFDCEQRPKDEIKKAVQAYQSRLGLTEAITNYYQNRALGKTDVAEEVTIMQLKAQLGYDQRYIDRALKEAQRKIKQGDLESACEDLNFIKNLGTDKANKLIAQNCK
jgi:TonB family protein